MILYPIVSFHSKVIFSIVPLLRILHSDLLRHQVSIIPLAHRIFWHPWDCQWMRVSGLNLRWWVGTRCSSRTGHAAPPVWRWSPRARSARRRFPPAGPRHPLATFCRNKSTSDCTRMCTARTPTTTAITTRTLRHRQPHARCWAETDPAVRSPAGL